MSQPPPLPSHNPYAAPVAHVEDFQDAQLVLADRGIRLLAKFIDGSILYGLVIVVAILAGAAIPMIERGGSASETTITVVAVVGSLSFIALIVANMVMLHRSGQTIGKRLLSIKILRSDGSRCSLPRIVFARWLPVTLMRVIPYVTWLVDSLMIFRADQRCLHDLIADTIVVKV